MGGSSSQVVGYRYFTNFLLFIGNPIEKLIGINFDKRGWITGRRVGVGDNGELIFIEAENLYGENEGGVYGVMRLHTGTDTQLPDVKYSQYMESRGLKASAYPYQSYLSFSGSGEVSTGNGWVDGVFGALAGYMNDAFYVGNSGYMKEMLLWPKRIHVRNDGQAQWYDEKAEIPSTVIVGESHQYVDINEEVSPIFNYYVEDLNTGFIRSEDTNRFPFSDGTTSNIAQGIVDNYEQNIKFRITGGDFNRFNLYRVSILIPYHVNEFSVSTPLGLNTINKSIRDVTSDYVDPSESNWRYLKVEYVCGSDPSNIGVDINAKGGLYRTVGDPSTGLFEYRVQATVSKVGDVVAPIYSDAGDINTIHKIREILTDDTAMNKPESSVNNINFIKAADRIFDEGLGISWSVTEKSCMDAINELCYHIEAGIRVNRHTGLYEMVLFRDDWFDEGEIHTIAESKIKKNSMQYEITNVDEVINQLNVNFYDRENIKSSSFSVAEGGLIQTMGRPNAETVDFPYFMNMRNAEIVANWKLKQLSTGALKGSFTTGWREARKWNRYDLIRLPWSKRWTGTILVRIMNIKISGPTSNEVSIEFVEVVPATGMMNTTIVADEPVNTKPEAPKPCNAKVFELPYFEAAQAFGERDIGIELTENPDAGYLCAIAEKLQNNSLNAALHVDSGNGFERVATINYCETAYLDQSIDCISNTFVVKNVGNIASVRIGSQIFINDETMVYQSYDAETKVLIVKRGAFGIPQVHAADSILYFADDFIAVDQTIYVQSEVVDAKVLTTTPSGVLALADAEKHEVEFNARAIRPYPPANVKINGEYWPAEIETDLILSWVDRNRVQQTGGEILGWYEGGVTIEAGVSTLLVLTQYDENHVELATNSANVSGTNTFTFPISSMQADTQNIEIALKTVRDGYECLQPFVHTVELSQFFSAPYDLTVEFKNDYRLELNWKLDGFVDEQRYYCSEMPINTSSPPTPKVILAADVNTYVDYDIVENKKYYIVVSSVRNGTEKFSDEFIVETTNDIPFYRVNLKVTDNSFSDIGTSGYTWSGVSSMTLLNDDTFSLNAGTTYKTNENFVFTTPWIIEFEFFVDSWASGDIPNLLSNMAGWTWGGVQLAIGSPNASVAEYKNKVFFAPYGSAGLTSSTDVDYSKWNKVKLTRYSDGMYTLLLNNVQVARRSISATPSTGPIHLQGYGIKYRGFKVKDLGNVPRVKLSVNSNNTVSDLGFEKFTWQVPSNVALDATNNQISFIDHSASMVSNEIFYWADPWTLSFKVFVSSTGMSSLNGIVGNNNNWTTGGFCIGYGGPGGGNVEGNLMIGLYGYGFAPLGAITTDAWHTVTIKKNSDNGYITTIDSGTPTTTSYSSSYAPKNSPIYFFTTGINAIGIKIRDFEIY